MASKLGPPRITRGQAKLHTDTDRDRILTAPGAVAVSPTWCSRGWSGFG
jgi:hypothetical protein